MNKKLYNIFKNIKFSKEREIEEDIYEDESVKIVRTMSLDQKTKYYNQEEKELIFLLFGRAELEFKDKLIKLEKGDMLEIKPHKIHRVVWQERAVWLCIFIKENKRQVGDRNEEKTSK